MTIAQLPPTGLLHSDIEDKQREVVDVVNALELLVPPKGYCDFSTNPTLLLTTTPVVLTVWTQNEISPPVGVTEAAGEFTVTASGVWNIDLERVYQNDDANPALLVNVTITVETDTGGGYTPTWTRTAPIMSATAIDEPAILSFTSPSIRVVSAGTKFRVLVSAEDSAGNPSGTYFVRAKLVAKLIANLP